MLQEYKAIYRKKFGKDISDEEALEQATSLLTLVNAIYRPVKKSWLKEFKAKEFEKPSNANSG